MCVTGVRFLAHKCNNIKANCYKDEGGILCTVDLGVIFTMPVLIFLTCVVSRLTKEFISYQSWLDWHRSSRAAVTSIDKGCGQPTKVSYINGDLTIISLTYRTLHRVLHKKITTIHQLGRVTTLLYRHCCHHAAILLTTQHLIRSSAVARIYSTEQKVR
jgi:hypothetical protein